MSTRKKYVESDLSQLYKHDLIKLLLEQPEISSSPFTLNTSKLTVAQMQKMLLTGQYSVPTGRRRKPHHLPSLLSPARTTTPISCPLDVTLVDITTPSDQSKAVPTSETSLSASFVVPMPVYNGDQSILELPSTFTLAYTFFPIEMHKMGHVGLLELTPELARQEKEATESMKEHVNVGVQTIDDIPKVAAKAPDLKKVILLINDNRQTIPPFSTVLEVSVSDTRSRNDCLTDTEWRASVSDIVDVLQTRRTDLSGYLQLSTPHHNPDLKDYVQVLLTGNLLDAELQVTSLVIPANRHLFIFINGCYNFEVYHHLLAETGQGFGHTASSITDTVKRSRDTLDGDTKPDIKPMMTTIPLIGSPSKRSRLLSSVDLETATWLSMMLSDYEPELVQATRFKKADFLKTHHVQLSAKATTARWSFIGKFYAKYANQVCPSTGVKLAHKHFCHVLQIGDTSLNEGRTMYNILVDVGPNGSRPDPKVVAHVIEDSSLKAEEGRAKLVAFLVKHQIPLLRAQRSLLSAAEV